MEPEIPMKKTNPIIPGAGVCDPHVHIFNNRAYLYASHDASPANTDWIMHDWQVWSSANLVDWHLDTTVRPEDTYVGPWDKCWALDAAERHGHYYLYFSKANIETGVLMADSPAGPWSDPLGKPLLPEMFTPTRSYDPTVFTDDDAARTPYIIYGNHVGHGYFIARLGDDMISLAEEPTRILIDDGWARTDKSFLHKHNGLYYLSWDSNYAISDDIRGPYRHVGTIGVSHDHGSFFEWNGQWFNAFTIFDPTYYYRSTGLCYIHYRANGEMVADQLIAEFGVGHYDAAWNKIEAEWFMAARHVEKRENQGLGFDAVATSDGACLRFPKVRNLKPTAGICFYAACNNPAGCVVEIRSGGPDGPLLGRCEIPSTFGHGILAYNTFTCRLAGVPDTLDLWLRVKGSGTELLRLDWFKFF
jgi:arabinoxylan arabinofuranohydrolase